MSGQVGVVATLLSEVMRLSWASYSVHSLEIREPRGIGDFENGSENYLFKTNKDSGRVNWNAYLVDASLSD